MLKRTIILCEKVSVFDRYGAFLFQMKYDDFMNSKYRLLDYNLYVYDNYIKIKILEPIVE